jgi:hypothetical protein
MATIVYGSLRYNTVSGEGVIKFTCDLDDTDKVIMLDTVNDWIYQLEALQKDLHEKVYADMED